MKTKVHHQLLILAIAEELKREIFEGYILFAREANSYIRRSMRRRTSIRRMLVSTDRAESLAIVARLMK